MEGKEKAQKSASNLAQMAEYIARALTLNYSPQDLKVVQMFP